MSRTPWGRLVLVAAVSVVVTAVVLRLIESRGGSLLPVPVLSSAVVLLIAAVVGTLGWTVRQYVRGKRPGLDPLLAARTVVLATASAYTGALLSGWYGGQVLLVVGDLEIDVRRDLGISAGAALVCTVVLAVVGLVVERWCEVPPPEADEPRGPGAQAAPGSAA